MVRSGRLLHANVEMTIGVGRFSTTVPPKHVENFRYTSRMSGPAGSRMECTLFDPTFVDLERALLSLDPRAGALKEPIVARWGFPQAPGVTSDVWAAERKFMMLRFTPDYTHTGARLQIEAAPWIEDSPRLADSAKATYRGKISDVVRQIARDMGFPDERIFVEESENFRHSLWGVAYGMIAPARLVGVEVPQRDLGDQEWVLGTTYPVNYINERMLPLARSADTGAPFEPARIDAGRAGPEFHFHPARETAAYARFVTWYGRSEDVIQFQPQYNSHILAAIGSRGVAAQAFDPDTKESVELRSGPANPSGAAPVTPPVPEAAGDSPEEAPAAAALVTQPTLEQAQAELDSIWAGMYYSIQQATLMLVGTPENMLLVGEDLIEIDAVLPDGSAHWSGGRYRVAEVVHEIGQGGYHLSCNLYRDFDASVQPVRGGLLVAQ